MTAGRWHRRSAAARQPRCKHADKTEEVALRGGRAVEVRRDQDQLHVLWEYDLPGQTVRVAWTYRHSRQGPGGLRTLRRTVGEPVLTGRCRPGTVAQDVSRALPAGPRRVSAGAKSCSSAAIWIGPRPTPHAARRAWPITNPKTDGTRNSLVETGYVTVSPDVGEVLPNIPHPPFALSGVCSGPRIMLDVWGHHRGTYQGDAENLLALKDHGVDHLAIISHVWQRYGYDVKLPDHLPANPTFGGDEGMIAFGKAANQCGYIWSLHENYIDLYPDAPSYDPAARVLRADGTPSPAWYNAGTQVQSFGLKCNRALGYAKQNSPEIHRRFNTTAAYLDVHTCVPPWHQLDHEADQPLAAMALAKVKSDTELFQFMRDTHDGPLFGEGANHFYWAGRCDGVEAQVGGGEDHVPLVDFDLLKIHPQMVNHGMGYYERWFRRGYDHRWGDDTGSMEQIDKYRAQELAYGHAGFVGAAQVDNLPWVIREHHLMHPVQRLYGTAQPVEIRYEVDGQFVTASAALVAGDTSRQRIRYDSGLRLWVNWRDEPWQVEGPRAAAMGLPGPGAGNRGQHHPARRAMGRLRRVPAVRLCGRPHRLPDALPAITERHRTAAARVQVPRREPSPGDVRVAGERHLWIGIITASSTEFTRTVPTRKASTSSRITRLPKPTDSVAQGGRDRGRTVRLVGFRQARRLRPGHGTVPRRTREAEGGPKRRRPHPGREVEAGTTGRQDHQHHRGKDHSGQSAEGRCRKSISPPT